MFAAVAATLLLMLLPPFGGAAATGEGSNCTRSCGNISVPYPFGIEPGCYHDGGGGFNLTCDGSYQPPRLFLGDGTVPVLEISIPNSTVRINSTRVNFTTDDVGTVDKTWGVGLPQGGLYFLWGLNMLHVESCNVQVDLLGGTGNDSRLVASCTAICPTVGPLNDSEVLVWDGQCAGIACCQANIDVGYSLYDIKIHKFNGAFGTSRDNLGSVYIVDRDFNLTTELGATPVEAVPSMLSWMIADSPCPTTANVSAPECRSAHSSCVNSSILMGTGTGHTCQCSPGYQGNPYITDGPDACQDIDECKSPDSYSCYGNCTNTPGNFTCLCPAGYSGNASVLNGCNGITYIHSATLTIDDDCTIILT